MGSPGHAVPNPTALQPGVISLVNRVATPANVLVIRDSISEGVGASTKETHWIDRLLQSINDTLPSGAPGGAGYIATTYNGGPTTPWTFTGAPSSSGLYGLGLRGIVIGTANTATLDVTCISIGLVLSPGRGADCTVSVVVDGGTAQSHTFTGAGGLSQMWAPATDGGSGPHTFQVSVTAGYGVLEGAYVYDGDESKGIRVWDSARSSAVSGDFASNLTNLEAAWKNTAADLVLVELGVNDWRYGVSVATFKTNMQSVLNGVTTACNRPQTFVLVIWPQPGTAGQNGQTASWADYVTAYHNIAASRTDTVVCDLSQRMYSYVLNGNSDPLGFYYTADNLFIHPSDKGSAQVAAQLLAFIAGELIGATEGQSKAGDAAWKAPSYQNAWVDLGSGFAAGGFRKDAHGFVHLKGTVKAGTGVIFNLPHGYRPADSRIFPVVSNDAFGEVRITNTGDVNLQVGSNTWASLDGITFYAEK